MNNIDTSLTLEQLNIELRTRDDGKVIDPSLYTLTIKVQTGWDDENDCPITADAEAPYGITGEENRQSGFQSYYAFVEAKEGSGYKGDFTNEFIIWDKHSLNWFGATTDFGEQYKSNSTWFWHDYFRIPVGEISEPAVSNIAHELIDPSEYTVTYYRRNTELPDFDDPEYADKVYPDDEPLDAMPTDEGFYFAKIEAKESSDYYGTSYIDFDILTPQSYAGILGLSERFYDGDTVSIRENETLNLFFELDPCPNGLIVGWNPESLEESGFTVNYVEIPEENNRACAQVSSEGVAAGTTGTLEYSWYRFEDVFGENAAGWENAKPVMESSVNFEVEGEPEGFILGDADQDDIVSILDATTIQKMLASVPVLSLNLSAADANRNGVNEILDATMIQKYLAHLLPDSNIGGPGYNGTYYAAWNMEQNLLPDGIKLSEEQAAEAQAEIRGALCILIDRSTLLYQVGIDKKPASSFVPNWITDFDGSEFYRNINKDFYGYFNTAKGAQQDNLDAAIATIRKYYPYDTETGKFAGFPTLTYLFNQGEVHRGIAEFIQSSFAELGIRMELKECEWNDYFPTIAEGNYSLARSGWTADFDDPMEFLMMWTSDSEDNDAGLGKGSHAELHIYNLDLRPYGFDVVVENGTWQETYDRLIDAIQACRNKENRYKMMHLAESMLMGTGALMPLYYY